MNCAAPVRAVEPLENEWVELREIRNIGGPGQIGSPWNEIAHMFTVEDVQDGRHKPKIHRPRGRPRNTGFMLSDNQKQAARLIGLGYTGEQASHMMGVSRVSLNTHLRHVRNKLPGGSQIEGPVTITAVALREGLITVDELIARLDAPNQ